MFIYVPRLRDEQSLKITIGNVGTKQGKENAIVVAFVRK